ncbi:hypothetical protein E2562_038247 [Oryza meyeriana var. granulata]|uniref:Uncharacterized protein n=1 Tax=Oryza meyeriana var. granulata TaxID=110450 RepID=A0A6G1BQU8_9ORYZ|nr:hypothetical protein E2562_038247 [Oryza meyeriana var. granulata]
MSEIEPQGVVETKTDNTGQVGTNGAEKFGEKYEYYGGNRPVRSQVGNASPDLVHCFYQDGSRIGRHLRPGEAVVLLHVGPTSVLYGADWGSIPVSIDDENAPDAQQANAVAKRDEPEEAKKKREEDFDAFTSTKAHDLAQPLVAAQIPFKIHIVKDHDMKERLCLEAERLGLSSPPPRRMTWRSRSSPRRSPSRST